MNIKRRQKRIFGLFIVIILAFTGIIVRLSYIKIIKNNEYYNLAIGLWTRSAPITGSRGNIYDRNGQLIVGNYLTPSVVAIPRQVEDVDFTAMVLAQILRCSELSLKNHLHKHVSVEIIKPEGRKIDIETAVAIAKANLKGIYVVGDTTRQYPYQTSLAQVLGIVGIDNQGITGIEYMYDENLKGGSGALQVFTDAHGNEMVDMTSLYASTTNGHDVYLTIDLDLQLSMERVLDNAMVRYNPEEIIALAINPQTSEILGMASRPTFNPRNYQDYPQEVYNRNLPIWKSYEPGSTFKICTFSAGLEEKVFTLEEGFYDPGYAIVDGTRIRDWKAGGHGKETFLEVIQNSCNPGFVTIGLRLGKERLFSYLRAFGFGSKTGVDLLGESTGILFDETKIGNVELATASFGQGNSVTMIQLINAASAAVNGGLLRKPYILKMIKNGNEVILENEPVVIRRVISEETSKLVAHAVESVVSLGTGRGAYIEGYRVGGKTGTAQIAENGHYVQGKYILSFLGIAPMNHPEVAVMVAIVAPKNTIQYGGVVAAPMVKEILTESFSILNINKRDDGIPLNVRYWIDKNIYVVDDYVGMTIGKIPKTSNYQFLIQGDGLKVIAQLPEAGDKIIEGGYVILYT